MKSNKKFIVLLAALILSVCCTLSVSLAWLVSISDTVTNTFTVGNIKITLDEAKVDEYGEAVVGATRVTENVYKLIPGHKYTKDPIVHVEEGSEPCYVFVKVEDGISAIQAATTVAAQIEANGWNALAGVTGVYYKDGVNAKNGAVDLKVFESFTIANDAVVSNYEDAEITVTAYAIQADGFKNASDAWTAVNTK